MFALNKLPGWNISYRDVYSTNAQMYYDEDSLTENLFDKFTDGGEQYDRVDFADVYPDRKQFILAKYDVPCERIAAFRWKNGKVFGLALSGNPQCEQEYMYVHLQKRAMKFEQGFENEDSFMIVPNEFVKDHELTSDEIERFMTPDTEYEHAFKKKYSSHNTLLGRIMRELRKSNADRIISLKKRTNFLLGRQLYSRYEQ